MKSIDTLRVDIRKAVTNQLPWGNNPVMRRCPQHQDDSDSLAIYPGRIKCFGCEFKVKRRMDALAWLLELPSYREAYEVAEQYYSTEDELNGIRKASEVVVDPPTDAMLSVYERLLWGQERSRLDWFHGTRGYTDSTIRSCRFGHTGASFVIPIFDKDYRLLTFRYRTDPFYDRQWTEYDVDADKFRTIKMPKYKGLKGLNDVALYPAWKIANDWRNWICIVEGEFDAARLWQEGIPASSVTNGAGSMVQILPLLPKRIKRLVIIGDMDQPGRDAVWGNDSKVGLVEEAALLGYEIVGCPEWDISEGKDVTEYLNNGHSLVKGFLNDYALNEEQTAYPSVYFGRDCSLCGV